MTDSIVLAGNNLAVLVGALELSKQGRKVTLFTDNQKPGGHFGGIACGERLFDIGMVTIEMVEPRVFDQALATYSPRVRNDWTRFADKSNAWLKNNVDLEQAPTTHCLVEGVEIPDYLLTNRLDGLVDFSVAPPEQLHIDDAIHPKNKTQDGLYDTLDYETASIACHGSEFHNRLIEPYVEKLAGRSSKELVARYHRGIWAPIYYPETLQDALAGQEIALPEYPFWSTKAGGIHDFVQSIYQKLKASEHVSLYEGRIGAVYKSGDTFRFETADFDCTSSNVAFGMAPARYSELFALASAPEIDALQLTVLFALVRKEVLENRPACIMIADRGLSAYRFTDQDAFANQDPAWHRIALEASSESLSKRYAGKEPEQAMYSELVQILRGPDSENQIPENAIQIAKCVTAKNALTIPTQRSISELEKMSESFVKAAPTALMTGSLLGYGVTSMNDQIVQGLLIADQFGSGT